MPIKNKSSKKLLKKGGTLLEPRFINKELNTNSGSLSDLFNKILEQLIGFPYETLKIRTFLTTISEKYIKEKLFLMI